LEIISTQCVLKELPAGPALLSAGSQDRPDTCVPLSAHQGSAALCNPPVNNSLAKGLLSGIVSRGHSRVKQEPKHRITMLAEAFRNRSRFRRQILLFSHGQYSISDLGHNPVKPVLWDFISKMPDVKKPLKISQQGFSEVFVGFIGQSRKKFYVPNQVSQTKLLNLIGIFDIGTEEITDYCTIVSFTENVSEHLRGSRFSNVEKTDCRGTEDPYPVFYALVFPAGLVDIQNRLSWDMQLEFFIRCRNGIARTRNCIAKMAPSYIDVKHLTAEVFQSTVGCVERAFHVANQSLQTQLEQLTFDNTSRRFSPDNSSTYRTDKSIQMVFSNSDRLVNKLDGLLNLRLVNRLTGAYIAAVTTICVKRDCFIDSIRPKRLSADTFMPNLSTLMPGMMPFRARTSTKGTPSLVSWRMVSS